MAIIAPILAATARYLARFIINIPVNVWTRVSPYVAKAIGQTVTTAQAAAAYIRAHPWATVAVSSALISAGVAVEEAFEGAPDDVRKYALELVEKTRTLAPIEGEARAIIEADSELKLDATNMQQQLMMKSLVRWMKLHYRTPTDAIENHDYLRLFLETSNGDLGNVIELYW